MAERKKIICPKCDNVIAIAPDAGLDFTDLQCSNCGAELRAPGPLEQAADKVKAVLRETEQKIEDKIDSK